MRHLLRLGTLCLGLVAASPVFAQIPGGGGCPGAATTSTLGCVKVDGTSITISGGVISAPTGGSGNVVGPASATDTDLASYNSTTGKLIQDSGITTANVDTLSGNQTITGNKVFSGTLSGAGLTNYLAAPAAIGGTTPAAGAFTTLAASSTVSGTGFSTYLASPPAIGGTAPAAGHFTTLSATGAITASGLSSGTCASGLALDSGNAVVTTSCGAGAGVSSLTSGSQGLVFSASTGDITATLPFVARSTSSAAIASTDGGGAVINTSGGMTIANATGGLGDGFAADVLAVAAATITPTTATINGNATEPLGINQGIEIFSKSGEYFAILGMPEPVASSVLVASSGRVPAWQAGTSSQLVKGDGSLGTLGTAAAVNTGTSGATIPLLNAANTWSAIQAFNDGDFALNGSSSGSLKLHAGAAASTSSITFPVGTTDFTATGGTSQFVAQVSAGAALTVVRPTCSSLSDSGTGCSTATGTSGATIPLLNGNNTYSGTNSHTGAETFAEVHGGLPETVTLTSNDYVAVAADCGKIKTLPTGTSPTVHLPNLNVGCTITFVTSVAKSYQVLPASGGTVWSSTGFNKTRGTAAGDTVSATITVNSASAAKWVISGDVTS